jgi:hypothetical protein
MSGSLTWRLYVADNGEKFSVQVAKHTAILKQNVAGGNGQGLDLLPVRSADHPFLSRGLEPRYAWFYPYQRFLYPKTKPLKIIVSDREFWARLSDPNQANILVPAGNNYYSSGYLIASYLVGERREALTRVDDLGF